MVSILRLNRFLLLQTLADEGDDDGAAKAAAHASIRIEKASFQWDSSTAPTGGGPGGVGVGGGGGKGSEKKGTCKNSGGEKISPEGRPLAASADGKPPPPRGADTSSPSPSFLLRDVTLVTRTPHELIGVIGSVGSGKSSLMSALLKEMPRVAGACHVHGHIAYCAQTPWIQNLSLRANVLFGLDYEVHTKRRLFTPLSRPLSSPYVAPI